jgi:hypothetical protein
MKGPRLFYIVHDVYTRLRGRIFRVGLLCQREKEPNSCHNLHLYVIRVMQKTQCIQQKLCLPGRKRNDSPRNPPFLSESRFRLDITTESPLAQLVSAHKIGAHSTVFIHGLAGHVQGRNNFIFMCNWQADNDRVIVNIMISLIIYFFSMCQFFWRKNPCL